MRFHDLSIRSKFVTILILMVVLPTVSLGLLLYIQFRNDVVDSTKKELISTAKNWQTITNSYVQQEDRVLKREQALVEQRLETTVLTAKKILELVSNGASRENAYNEISKITLGRSGYAFILDKNGKYILSKDRLRDGESLGQMTNTKGEYFIRDIITKVRALGGDDTYTTSYEWKEVGDTKLRKILVTFVYSKATDLVLGAGTYYSDFQSADLKIILQDELRARMSAQRIKDNGYVEAINSEGEYLVSKDNLRNGENLLNYQDEDGSYLIKNIIAESTKLGRGETYSKTYTWKNIGEDHFFSRLTTFVYVPEWDWIIGATAYEDDYLAATDAIRFYIFLIGALAVVLGSLVAYRVAYYITKPIKELEGIALKATKGDLGVRVSSNLLSEGAEIGSLAKSFNDMIINVDQNITKLDISNKEIAQNSKTLESKNSELEKSKSALSNLLEDVEEEKIKALALATIIKNSKESIISEDLKGNITSWNQGAENLYGYTEQEVIGKSSKLIVPVDRQEEVENLLKIASEGGTADHFQTVRKRKDGRLVDVSVSVALIKDSHEKITGMSSISSDITKEKEIDKAKTEFVSLASHQLRTPLSTINWYTEMLMAGDAGSINENQKKFLGEIYMGSTRMVDLVNSLLNVSRLELGTFVIEPEPTDMVALTRSVMDEQKPQLDERKQTLIPTLDKTVPIMQVDPKLMRMVVQNLLSNAIKYTPEEGKIELTLSLDNEKKNMILKVSDNGYGITKNQQDQIFMKLFRADNVKAKDTVGTGLGLYIVKSIVEHSEGKIWFDSIEDKGTTFYVSLPLSGMKKKEGQKALS